MLQGKHRLLIPDRDWQSKTTQQMYKTNYQTYY